jgi:hypothetical protein
VLNSYFENDFDSFTSGSIIYDLGYQGIGSHTVTVRAWDNSNNSSVATIDFRVEPDDKFVLRNLTNYPNPFTGGTRISVEHNRADEELGIVINIFSLDGRIIKIIKTKAISSGFVLTPIFWDGNIEGGKRAGRGLYPYTVTITTTDGETAISYGRMIIL